MAEFSHILHDLRTRQGLTQKELAVQLGVSYSTISMYERGRRQPDLDMLAKLAAFFGVSVDSFFGNSPAETESPLHTALRQFAQQKHIPFAEALRWATEGDTSSVMRLCDPDGLATPPLVPTLTPLESQPLTPHEQAVLQAYRQRPDVRPFVDKLLDVKD